MSSFTGYEPEYLELKQDYAMAREYQLKINQIALNNGIVYYQPMLSVDEARSFLKDEMLQIAPYNPSSPYTAEYANNGLESRLENRRLTYNPDDVNNIKVLLAPSGTGKTRCLLELLHERHGYYFISHVRGDFGSEDFALCRTYSERNPVRVAYYIQILLLVRGFVCNYLLELGYIEPHQILLAQLHPKQFFGVDIFKVLYEKLVNLSTKVLCRTSNNYFPFVTIDDVDETQTGETVFDIGIGSKRPFFSPLMLHLKVSIQVPMLVVTGTNFNVEMLDEMVPRSVMKPSFADYNLYNLQ